jgi:hypothetical protein
MPAAVWVPAAITAAASIYGAVKSSSTSKDVAKQQIAAQLAAGAIDEKTAAAQLAFLERQDTADRQRDEIIRQQLYGATEANRQQDYNLTTAGQAQNYGLATTNSQNLFATNEADRRQNYGLTTTNNQNTFTQNEALRKQNYGLTEADRRTLFDVGDTKATNDFSESETDRRAKYDKYIALSNELAPYAGMGKSASSTLAYMLGLSKEKPIQSTAMPDPKTTTPWLERTLAKAPYTAAPGYEAGTFTKAPAYEGAAYTKAPAYTPPGYVPTPPYVPIPTASHIPGTLGGVANAGTPGGVRMRGPDGSIQTVPAETVAYFQRQGAQLV